MQRPRQPDQIPEVVAVVDGHGVDRRAGRRIPPQRVQQHGRAGGAVDECGHELTLIGHPIQISAGCRAGADEPQRRAAVELLASGRQVDAGQWVTDRFGRAHGHAADGVDEFAERAEVDLHPVVDRDPELRRGRLAPRPRSPPKSE